MHAHCYNLRFDGLPNVFRRQQPFVFRLVWLFIFFASGFFCLFLIMNSVRDFLKFRITTTYRLQSELNPVFPMITVCNINSLNSAYYIQLFDEAQIAKRSMDPFFYDTQVLTDLEDYSKQTSGHYFTAEQRRNLTDLDGLVISCTFQNKPCNRSQFQYVFNPLDIFNCLRFNSGFDAHNRPVEKLRATGVSSPHNELTMELYVGLPDALRRRAVARGALVLIQNQTESPIKLSTTAVKLSPRTHTHIDVTRTVYKQFNEWPFAYSECLVNELNELMAPLNGADRALFDQVVALNYTYSRDTCILACYQQELARACNCTDYWVDVRIDGLELCVGELNLCASRFFFSTFQSGDYIDVHCSARCPFECQRYRFDYFESSKGLLSPSYVNNVLRNNAMLISRYANESDFKSDLALNVVKFSLTYGAGPYREASEDKRMSWDDLLAQLGGHLHLFLGMSLLSCIELFEFFFQILNAFSYR